MPVLRDFYAPQDPRRERQNERPLAGAKPPSRAENAQTRRSAEDGERERRPSGEPKRRQTAQRAATASRKEAGEERQAAAARQRQG